MKEKLKEFLSANWTWPEKVFLILDVLLAGVMIGWLTSPFRKGSRWFCGNAFGGKYYAEPDFFEEDEEE